MKKFFKLFVKGGTYYSTALYILLLILFNASMDWWIFSTIFFTVAFCFVDFHATQAVRELNANEAFWRNEYFAEKNLFELEVDSHKGTQKRYIELVHKLKTADQTISQLSEEKANLLDSVTYYKVAK